MSTQDLEQRIADYQRLVRKDQECDNPFSAHLVRNMCDKAGAALVAEGDALVPTLARLLKKPPMAQTAMNLLCRLDRSTAVVDELLRALDHTDPDVQRRATTRLGALGVVEAFDRLARPSVSDEQQLAATVWSLVVLDGERALPLVEHLVTHDSPIVRRALARGAARAELVPLLDRLADDLDWLVGHTCWVALYHCDPAGFLTRARARLGGGHPGDVCRHVISIGAGTTLRETGTDIDDLGDALFPSLAGLPFATRRHVVFAVVPRRTVDLVDLLFRGPPLVGLQGRARLEAVLGYSVRRAWSQVAKESVHHDRLTCEAGFLTREETVQAILRGLASASGSDVEDALELTDTLHDPRILEALAQSPNWSHNKAIARAMAPYGEPALQALERLCCAADRRAHVPVRRLAYLPLEGVQDSLERLAKDRSLAGRRDVIEALGERGPSDVLVRIAADEADPHSWHAARALLPHGPPGRLPALVLRDVAAAPVVWRRVYATLRMRGEEEPELFEAVELLARETQNEGVVTRIIELLEGVPTQVAAANRALAHLESGALLPDAARKAREARPKTW